VRCIRKIYHGNSNMIDNKYVYVSKVHLIVNFIIFIIYFIYIIVTNLYFHLTLHSRLASNFFILVSMSYKHLQHQVILLASVLLNLQSVYAYGRVVSDPVEGAQYYER
jgi:hypothetical protein